MKTPLLCLIFGLACSAMAFAQDTQGTQPTTGSADGACAGKWRQVFAQLDLTDAQKAQIKQIRGTVTNRKERRQQIMAVLTPAQKQKLLQMIQQHRQGAQAASTSAGT